MDLNQPPSEQQPANPQAVQATVPAIPGKLPSTLSFIAGILLFFMPFLDIKCNDLSLQKVSGINLATGFELKSTSSNSLFGGINEALPGQMNSRIGKSDTREANQYAVIALLAGVAGFILSLLAFRGRGLLGVLLGGGAAIALILLMVDVKKTVNAQMPQSSLSDQMDMNMRVAVEFTPWFYLAVLLFALAAYFSYKSLKSKPPSS